MGNMTEIHNEESELNVDVSLTDRNKRNFNGNYSDFHPKPLFIH